MIGSFFNILKIYAGIWNISSRIATVISSIVLGLSQVIGVIILIGIPILAIWGIISLIVKKKKKQIKTENNVYSLQEYLQEVNEKKEVIEYNKFIDVLMIILTCGLWGFWMVFRPKYKR